MAKNRGRSSTGMGTSGGGFGGTRRGGGRQGQGGGQPRQGQGQGQGQGGMGGGEAMRMGGEAESMRGGGAGTSGRGRKGMMAEAREMAVDLGESTMETARDVARSTQGAAGQVVGYVKEHPWPALLIGAGATWLAIDAARGGGRGSYEAGPTTSRTREGGRLNRNQEDAGMMNRTVSAVTDASRGAGQQVQQFVRENPLLAGAAALGVGVAVGMTLPGTIQENRMLGEARDAVVRRARSVADGTMRSVRSISDTILPE